MIDCLLNMPEWVKVLLGIGGCIAVYSFICTQLDRRRHKDRDPLAGTGRLSGGFMRNKGKNN